MTKGGKEIKNQSELISQSTRYAEKRCSDACECSITKQVKSCALSVAIVDNSEAL